MIDVAVKNLEFQFITEYDFWLRSVRKCNHSTTIKYLRNFGKIINRGIRNGWPARDPFVSFEMIKRKVELAALTETELQNIREKEFSAERHGLVKEIFYFLLLNQSSLS